MLLRDQDWLPKTTFSLVMQTFTLEADIDSGAPSVQALTLSAFLFLLGSLRDTTVSLKGHHQLHDLLTSPIINNLFVILAISPFLNSRHSTIVSSCSIPPTWKQLVYFQLDIQCWNSTFLHFCTFLVFRF